MDHVLHEHFSDRLLFDFSVVCYDNDRDTYYIVISLMLCSDTLHYPKLLATLETLDVKSQIVYDYCASLTTSGMWWRDDD